MNERVIGSLPGPELPYLLPGTKGNWCVFYKENDVINSVLFITPEIHGEITGEIHMVYLKFRA